MAKDATGWTVEVTTADLEGNLVSRTTRFDRREDAESMVRGLRGAGVKVRMEGREG